MVFFVAFYSVAIDYVASVTLCIVIMQPAIGGNDWPHSIHSSSQCFQYIYIEISRVFLSLEYKFLVNHTLGVKANNEHVFGH